VAGVWAASVLVGLVLIPALYFVSLGPMVWMFSRIEVDAPDWLDSAIDVYFLPVRLVHENSPEPVREALESYVNWFEGV